MQVSIGVLTGSFSVTTEGESATPDPFGFTPQIISELGMRVISETITLDGINTGTTLSVSGALYSLNSGAYTAATGPFAPTDTISLAMTSATSFGMTQTGYLVIGGVT